MTNIGCTTRLFIIRPHLYGWYSSYAGWSAHRHWYAKAIAVLIDIAVLGTWYGSWLYRARKISAENLCILGTIVKAKRDIHSSSVPWSLSSCITDFKYFFMMYRLHEFHMFLGLRFCWNCYGHVYAPLLGRQERWHSNWIVFDRNGNGTYK